MEKRKENKQKSANTLSKDGLKKAPNGTKSKLVISEGGSYEITKLSLTLSS